jgi:hypothetical protein
MARADGDLLARICEAAIAQLPVDAATVALATGQLGWAPAHATDEVVARLEEYAFAAGEGPCVDVLREHAPVLVGDLDTRSASARWPAWTPAARDAGIRSVFALPIQAGAISTGVMTFYAHEETWLEGRNFAVAVRFAEEAFVGLLDQLSGLVDGADGHAPNGHAELLRADVHRAAGMVMGQTGLPIGHALARLRAHAFAGEQPLSAVAGDVLAGRLRFAADDTRHN